MIGNKKLATIRQEIEQALAAAGGDPIQRLERQLATAKRKGDRTEVLAGLQRFLQSPRRQSKQGVGAKTGGRRSG